MVKKDPAYYSTEEYVRAQQAQMYADLHMEEISTLTVEEVE